MREISMLLSKQFVLYTILYSREIVLKRPLSGSMKAQKLLIWAPVSGGSEHDPVAVPDLLLHFEEVCKTI